MVYEIVVSAGWHDIEFEDWAVLLTLCLAPLIAHIAAGVPQITYIHSRRPSWHDRLCHYNPTSILWRYMAIIDRRCRAKTWTPLDLAASNAVFWDGYKWDGSEEMIQRSRDFCIRTPKHHRNQILSGTTIATIIVTVQGVQALHSMISGTGGTYAANISVSTLFYPLACLGLLRLPAAFWLTNDYVYRDVEEWDTTFETRQTSDIDLQPNKKDQSSSTLITEARVNSFEAPVLLGRFESPRHWKSLLVKSFYLAMICGLFVLCVYFLAPRDGFAAFTLTDFTLNILFLFFLAITICTVATCIVLARCRTTVIPCLGSAWYKLYTGILFLAMLLVFIFAALETRRTPCGRFTTMPNVNEVDAAVCGLSTYVKTSQQGLANSTYIGSSLNATRALEGTWYSSVDQRSYGLALSLGQGEIGVLAFDGWCKVDSKVDKSDFTVFGRLNYIS